MDAKRTRLRLFVLALPVFGILLAARIHPAAKPAPRAGVVLKSDDAGFAQGAPAPAIAAKYTVQHLSRRETPAQRHLRWLRMQYPYGRIPPDVLRKEVAREHQGTK